jgi:serine protease AprX
MRAGLTGLLTVVGLAAAGSPAAASEGPPIDVIVRTDSPQASSRAEAMVRRSGGTVGRDLPLISGFAARVPAGAVPALERTPGVGGVSEDGEVRLKGNKWIDDGGADIPVGKVKKAAGGKKANTEALTGAGIGVALIDSGVAPVTGLNQPGKVVNGPDLSFESQTPGLVNVDTYGHGTHMAGIIAGSDAGFEGIAPGAKLISLKVAAADGASDVSQVIAAIDWAVAHKDDPGLNIRVLNLSFGTDSTQSTRLDPLSYAVEAAWRKGIVVVVAAGNDGAGATRVTMPAANPYVLAVGAADPNGTDDRADDTVASFSNRGNATRHPDLLAAGRSVVSLRVPGSYIDSAYPKARVADAAGVQRFFRGSGTSQAAAVVSGSVALLLQSQPKLTPDLVKNLLVETADPLIGADPIAAGAGQIDIAETVTLGTPRKPAQTFPAATGLGTLEGARGSLHVIDERGVALFGERDIFGVAWRPGTWAPLAGRGKAWTGGTWNGSVWSGTAYTGTSWASVTWKTATWTSTSWSGRSWSGSNWSGRAWTAGGWTGRAWTTGTWLGRAWTGRSWS